MSEIAESALQGLNVDVATPSDSAGAIVNTSSPSTDVELARDLEMELAKWTNFQFPTATTSPVAGILAAKGMIDAQDGSVHGHPKPGPSADRVYSPDRDHASRSRHKALALEDLSTVDGSGASSGFFGGAVPTAGQQPSAYTLGHERAKLLQAHQFFQSQQHHFVPPQQDDLSMDEFFSSWGFPASGATMIDPFAGAGHGAVDPFDMSVSVNGDVDLSDISQPLTVQTAATRVRPQAQPQLRISVNPANTSKSQPASAKILTSPTSPLDGSFTPAINASGVPLTPAEDKRRRNTLASARFRAKKKEREAAMEDKAKSLDDRVANLERECEALRKENRMLKSLLVGGDIGGSSGTPHESAVESTAKELGGANISLLEELVRLLRANTAAPLLASGSTAPPPATSAAPPTTTGKRKRGAHAA